MRASRQRTICSHPCFGLRVLCVVAVTALTLGGGSAFAQTVQDGTLALVQEGFFPMWDMIKSVAFGGPGGDAGKLGGRQKP